MIDHIEIDPGRFQAVINIYLNLSLALNSTEAKQFKTRAEYRDYLVIKATARHINTYGILLIRTLIYGWRIKMEIIIKVDHDDLNKVKTFSTKDRERDQLIHTIKYRDDQLHHLRTRQDELLMNLQNKDDEIQDLKLENDRLKQREEIMLHFIKSCACMYSCKECDITDKQNHCHYLQLSDSNPIGPRMRKTSRELLSRLEDL